ncbi:MAG TPA: ATP-dependent DNA helicase [Candidatus Paceibacterota bacterium]|nr:ATP-dependent DNA helicase [Candidatus Paceibacterota bacterium]
MPKVKENTTIFEEEYKKLNKAQKEAVDIIDGPVMVVAGPGTGKTQILSLRIGNILRQTDIKAPAILCLTFTNSAVEAMKERLLRYIGETGKEVNVFTFHGFGMKIIEKYYSELGFGSVPKLLDDADTAILFDEILHNNDWEYLRPRSDSSRYFRDLRSLISLLKRELITPEYLKREIEKEIQSLESNPENISTRGESKGELKKEFLSKIEGLNRSQEVVKFFKLYEEAKKEKQVLDYDDVLSNLVKIVEKSSDALSDIQEGYLYVLVDEHQDSSAVQNKFLEAVWGDVEMPNVFVVGDDRQLIYGFSGASIDHFAGFKKTFKGAKFITLVDNYRSTQVILDASHALLASTMTDEKLVSQSKEHHPIRLFEAEYPREEIIAAAMDIKDKLKHGVKLEDCAILVSKNTQVREALLILHQMGLPISSLDALNLFDQEEANAFFRVLKIISDPNDRTALALSFFDQLSGVTPLEAHTYLVSHTMRDFSLNSILSENQKLFGGTKAAQKWIQKLNKWREDAKNNDLIKLTQIIGEELLLQNKDDGHLVAGKEILSTILALVSKELEKNKDITLPQFILFIERLESYNEHIPVIMEAKGGVKVLTLHSSKGLEFDYVWIAHVDERSLNGGKKMGFVLPLSIGEKVIEQDIDRVKRKLYVAITRAKRFCTLSYARHSLKDSELEVARIVADLPKEVFEKHQVDRREMFKTEKKTSMLELLKLVASKYKDRYVSVSLLNNFFECPWKWYFRNLLGLPEREAETLQFGSIVHASIDGILKIANLPRAEEIEKIINEEVLKMGFKNERTRIRIVRDAENLVVPWVKNRLPKIKLSRKTEEGISMKDARYPHLKIFGKIDLIENLGDKEVRVTDFKTGSVKRRSEIEKLDEEGRPSNFLRQLAMYSYLLENNPKWAGVSVRESQLEFLEAKDKKESMYSRVVTLDDIQLLIKDIQDYDNLVKTGEWVDRSCNYNSYGKNIECEYCKMAEMYK